MPAPVPLPASITFLCPECDYPVRAAGSMSGRSAACPVCGAAFIVPLVDPAGREGPGAVYAATVARVLAALAS